MQQSGQEQRRGEAIAGCGLGPRYQEPWIGDASFGWLPSVLAYTIGGTNASTVPAGGTIQYDYDILNPSAQTTNDPFLEVTATDRRGNVTEYVYSPFDTLLEKREQTRGFRNGEPEA